MSPRRKRRIGLPSRAPHHLFRFEPLEDRRLLAVFSAGAAGDEQTSIIYNADTGELGIDAPASVDLTSININSAAAIFTGDPARNLAGGFDHEADDTIFKAVLRGSFASHGYRFAVTTF